MRRQNKFIYRRFENYYEIHEIKRTIVMDNHKFYLFKMVGFDKKWWIADSETGIYVTKGKTIDEAYDNLFHLSERLQHTYKLEAYEKMKYTYSLIVEDWRKNGERFTEISNSYNLIDED